MVSQLIDRLRRTHQRLRVANPLPHIFIGSSKEGLEVARALQQGLDHDPVDARVWTEGVFGASGTAFGSLLDEVYISDFGVFVVLPDDTVTTRGTSHPAPRDNVIFEIGLFMGQLGRERTLLVKPRQEDIKLPTDLLGLKVLDYSSDSRKDLASRLGPATDEIRKRALTSEPLQKLLRSN